MNVVLVLFLDPVRVSAGRFMMSLAAHHPCTEFGQS
jgi:hypothetical protein